MRETGNYLTWVFWQGPLLAPQMFHCSLQFNNDSSSKSHLKVCELILQQSTRSLIVLQPTRSELGLRIPPEHYSVGSESSPVSSYTQTQATAVRQASLERAQFNPLSKLFLSAELAGCTSSGSSSFFAHEQNTTIGDS